MKIIICNIPLQAEKYKTRFVPLGALAIIQSLQSAGYGAGFYDIHFYRPSDQEIKDYFLKHKFDVVGISAIVSTSYRYLCRLVSIIRSVLPDTIIVVGGALTASSEILLKFNDIDFCVIGEGEKVIVNLMNYIASHGRNKSEEELRKIRGLCFLNRKGDVIFTGYEKELAVDEILDPDYTIIEKHSNIDQYIIEPFTYEELKSDERSFQKRRENKRLATVVTSRGCVNRCTFCHRWQRGIRIFPVDRVIWHIRHLMEYHNIGFISFGDEDFGASKRWLGEFVEKIEPLDILYRIQGICCRNIDLPLLKKLKKSGCIEIHYGFESGSNRILQVMEKRVDVGLNERVAKWTHEAGLLTFPHILVGMPGESYETVKETTDFTKRITEYLPREPLMGINALVVLPGAPVYEYARHKGLLGKTLTDEENYLLRVSDRGGTSQRQLNLTDYPYFIVQGWIRCICWAFHYNYYKRNEYPRVSTRNLLWAVLQIALKRRKKDKSFSRSIYCNPLFYHLRYFTSPIYIMWINFKEDKMLFLRRCLELMTWPFKKKKFTKYISLRNFLYEEVDSIRNIDKESVQVLKLGK